MAVRGRSSLFEQANYAAIGGEQHPRKLSEEIGRAFQRGVLSLKDVHVAAYYPATRRYYDDVTRYLTALSWTDSIDQAAIEAQLEFDNSDGQVGQHFNRPGMIFFISVKGARGARYELLRLVAWDTELTDLEQGQLRVTAVDHLLFLKLAKGSFSFKNLTAAQIVAEICRIYRIPVVTSNTKAKPRPRRGATHRSKKKRSRRGPHIRIPGGLVKTRYKIPRFVKQNVSLYNAILEAYNIDSEKTGNYYRIESHKGRVRVRRTGGASRKILAITDGRNLRSASFSRSMGEYAAIVLPRGTVVGKDGKPRRRSAPPPTKATPRKRAGAQGSLSAKQKAAKKKAQARARERLARARRRGESPKKTAVELQADNRDAIVTLFGFVKYDGPGGVKNIRDPDWTRKAAQGLADRLSRAQKTLTIEADGNALTRQGDKVYVAIPFARKGDKFIRMRKEVFVSAVEHNLTPEDYVMRLECAWREKEIADKPDANEEPAERQGDEQKDAPPAKGKYSKEDLVALAESEGFRGSAANIAAAIGMAESMGNPAAVSPTQDYGLMQINRPSWSGKYDWSKIHDPSYNMKAAYEISKGGTDFSPWTTYKSGAYKKYL